MKRTMPFSMEVLAGDRTYEDISDNVYTRRNKKYFSEIFNCEKSYGNDELANENFLSHMAAIIKKHSMKINQNNDSFMVKLTINLQRKNSCFSLFS